MTAAVFLGRRFGGALSRVQDPPDPDTLSGVRGVLLASEERAFSEDAVAMAARLAERSGAPVHVLSIARIWGTSFGFPNPGLMPNKQEWEDQRSKVQRAVWELDRKGLEAEGHVIGARNAAKKITREAARLHCDAIVMSADEPRNRFLGNFIWSQEPQRVRRRADIPVYLLTPH